MSQHVTRYKTENGKTRKAKKNPSAKAGEKSGAPEINSGVENKREPGAPGK